jgi:protein O-mannosyl-transferase
VRRLNTRRRWELLAICLLLSLATMALYSPVTSHPFINYGDASYVVENSHIRSGLSWQTARWALKTTYSSTWHPVTWLSHAFDYQVYGLNAGGHHFINVLIHSLNVLLVFLLLWRVTRSLSTSALCAALFSLHPLNVGTVAWIAERRNLLSVFFVLLAVGAYGWYVQKPSWRRYAAVTLFFALGLASSPTVITLPFLLFLLDGWPLGRIESWTSPNSEVAVTQLPWTRLALEKLPLLLLSIGDGVLTIVAQRGSHSFERLGYLPLSWRLENAAYSCAMYLAKIFWPTSLALEYPHPMNSLTLTQIGLSFLVLAAVSAIVWKQRSNRPYGLTGWLWFVVSLLPVIGIVQVGTQGMADRYVYLPAMGIFLIVAMATRDFVRSKSLNRKFLIARMATVGSIAMLAALAIVSVRQIRYWRSNFDLWRHTLQTTRNNVVANDAMAELLLANGRVNDALSYFQSAARIASWDPESHAAIAAITHDRGQLQQAIDEYDIALRAHPDEKLQARIYSDLGVIYLQLGKDDRARENSRLALAADPQEVQDFIRKLSSSLAQQPTAFGYWLLGLRFEGADQIPKARAAYDQALKLNPQFSPAMRSLALLYMRPETANTVQ